MMRTTLLLSLLAWSAPAVQAQDGDAPGPDGRDGPGRRGFDRGRVAGMILARAADADRSGDVSADERKQFLASLKTDDKGVVDADSLGELLPMRGRRGGRGPGAGRRGPGGPGGPGGGMDRSARLVRMLDQDGDGAVTRAEIEKALAGLDKNGDGAIAGDEMPQRRRRGRRAMVPLAKAADKDGDGTVTAEEWRAFVATVTKEDGTIGLKKLATAMPAPEGRRGPPAGGPGRGPGRGPEGRPGRGPGRGPGGPEGRPGRDPARMLGRVLDRDRDGTVKVAELEAVFGQLDADKDGKLAGEELRGRRRGPGPRGDRPRGPRRGQGKGKDTDKDKEAEETDESSEGRGAAMRLAPDDDLAAFVRTLVLREMDDGDDYADRRRAPGRRGHFHRGRAHDRREHFRRDRAHDRRGHFRRGRAPRLRGPHLDRRGPRPPARLHRMLRAEVRRLVRIEVRRVLHEMMRAHDDGPRGRRDFRRRGPRHARFDRDRPNFRPNFRPDFGPDFRRDFR